MAIAASDIFKASMGIDYLKRFMPDDLLNLLDDGQKAGANNAARTLLTTPSNYKPRSPTTSDTGGDGGQGRSIDGINGLGSLSSLMDNPSRDNLQGLQNFAALNDTMLGRAMLDAMGAMLDFAINPAPHVVGLVQGIAGGLESNLLGTSKIADSLASFKSIPRMEALAANRAAISMNYDFNNMTPQQVDNIGLVSYFDAIAAATGDKNVMNDPTITAVGRVNGQPAIQVQGPLGGVRVRDNTGTGSGWISVLGGKFTPVDEKDLEKAREDRAKVTKNARYAAALNNPVDPDTEANIGGGRTGPEMGTNVAPIAPAVLSITAAMTDAFGTDDTEDDEGTNPNAGRGSVAESVAEADISGGRNDGGDSDPGGYGGAVDAGTPGGGFDAIDPGGYNDAQSAGTPSESSVDSSFSSDYKLGGLVKRRNTQNKKTRRGLASR